MSSARWATAFKTIHGCSPRKQRTKQTGEEGEALHGGKSNAAQSHRRDAPTLRLVQPSSSLLLLQSDSVPGNAAAAVGGGGGGGVASPSRHRRLLLTKSSLFSSRTSVATSDRDDDCQQELGNAENKMNRVDPTATGRVLQPLHNSPYRSPLKSVRMSPYKSPFKSPRKPIARSLHVSRNIAALLIDGSAGKSPTKMFPDEALGENLNLEDDEEMPEEKSVQVVRKPSQRRRKMKSTGDNFVRLNMRKKSFVRGKPSGEQKRKWIKRQKFKALTAGSRASSS